MTNPYRTARTFPELIPRRLVHVQPLDLDRAQQIALHIVAGAGDVFAKTCVLPQQKGPQKIPGIADFMMPLPHTL